MTNILARLVEQQGQVPVNQPRDDMGQDRALERFQTFSPSKFLGGSDPEAAERWLESMINIFTALNYTEDRQVQFTVFQFEGPARAWWNVIRAKWERERTAWTWVIFVREFNEKYLPPIVQEKREFDFIKLRQGTLSVSEYETQFTKLSKFAPELIATEQRRVRRFVQGLNVEIQEALAAAQINTFTEVLEKAQRIEIARLISREAWKVEEARIRELLAGVALIVGVGVDRHRDPRKNPEGKGVKRVDHNLDPNLSGGSGGNCDSTDD
nr:uncharacterized protein LOC113704571 [Coffea arabica]